MSASDDDGNEGPGEEGAVRGGTERSARLMNQLFLLMLSRFGGR